MATVAGRITDLPRMVGFSWVLEWEIYDYQGENISEVTYVSLDPTSANGGTYFIQHDDETGRWFAYEMGGAGPMVWERDIAYGVTFPSPLAAMLTIKREYNREIRAQIRAEEEMERFFEMERQRAREKETQGAQLEGVWFDEMGYQ